MCSYKEINEWFKWKNTPVKDRKLQSVEKKFNDYTKICGGDKASYSVSFIATLPITVSLTQELPPTVGGADIQIEYYNLGYEQNIAV